eukprot:TRINITY_DN10956_c0_g5_i1.p1 TRINITY_DN10956_c0_g5~~TRINITY_DN10956_c0_g5_i1.p1  ORF type:complete len:482 (+),score=94.13 TRINITY_DN10956_c0_g5_i1:118-1563(+)
MTYRPRRAFLIVVALALIFLPQALPLGQSIPCQKSSQCPRLYRCDKVTAHCKHKNVFPLTNIELLGSGVVLFVSGLANAGGLGGGALMIPILLLIFNFDSQQAIIISYTIVFGGSIGNVIVSLSKRDPMTNLPYINYDIALLCLPMLLMGTIVGVWLSRVIPELFILIILCSLLVYTFNKTWRKYRLVALAETQQSLLPDNQSTSPLTVHRSSIIAQELRARYSFQQNAAAESQIREVQDIYHEEHQIIPWGRIAIVFLLIISIVIIILLRGSKRFDSLLGFEFCSPPYWILYSFQFSLCVFTSIWITRYTQRKFKIKQKYVEYFPPTTRDDFELNPERIQQLLSYSFIAGILAGFLGLGGGMVLGPRFLDWGIDSNVVTATTGFTIIFTSMLSVMLAVVNNALTLQQILWYVGLAFFGSYGVSLWISRLVEKTKKKSYVLLSLSSVIGGALILLVPFSIWNVSQHGAATYEFKNPCIRQV